jgi:hypothetical protein
VHEKVSARVANGTTRASLTGGVLLCIFCIDTHARTRVLIYLSSDFAGRFMFMGHLPSAMEDFDSINLVSVNRDPARISGGIIINRSSSSPLTYKLIPTSISGKKLTFKTQIINGISFRFEGRVTMRRLPESDGGYDVPFLQGTLSKFRHGRKMGEIAGASSMKNSPTKWHPRFLLLIGAIVIALLGCGGGSKDLTRSSAQRMIEAFEKFKQPIGVVLKDEDEWQVRPKSSDETEQDAQARAMEMYLSDKRAVAVLRHLGYVDVKITLVKQAEIKGSGVFASVKPWVFRVEPALTEKGREAAKSQGVTGDKSVVFGRREVVEVTGIREKEGQAVADFTWKTVATEAGKAFDPASDAFKTLPPELREAVSKSKGIGPFGSTATQDWSQINKAVANFQKYDDGWRLTAISSGLF